METEKLRQFCAVVETGSLTQASEVMGISLSGLSKSMQSLQDDLGFLLFLPEGRGISITDSGKRIYQQSQEVLRQIGEMRRIQVDSSAQLRVGGMEVFTHSFLGRVLHEEFEGARIEILDLGAGDLERALIQQKIEAGVTYFPQPQEGIEFLKIKRIRLMAFRRKSAEPVKEVEELRFVSPMSIDHQALTDIFEQDGWPDYRLPRNHGVRTNRLATAVNLVHRSSYAIFIPQFLADELNEFHSKENQLEEIKIFKGSEEVYREVFLAKRKGTPEGKLFKTLAKRIRKDL